MNRPQTTAFSDSNLANFGSDLEHKIKEAAADCERAWDGVGEAGIRVWRIEKFKVVEWPSNQLGKFYNGDSYILLHSYKIPDRNAIHHDVHFWLGEETSQDEAGTAAYKTVELDDKLGGAPVQHREIQGHESSRFLGYFPENTIEVLKGGVDSGFNHVEPEKYDPRLLHVKGTRRNVRVTQVEMSRDSMNSGDVFIMDLGLQIIQWNGKKASLYEKMRAGQMVRAIRDERKGLPEATMHEQDSDDGDEEMQLFWSKVGGQGEVKDAEDGGSDADAAAEAAASTKLFRLSEEAGKITFALEKTGSLSKADLDSKDAFVLDNGAEVFVWIGRGASKLEKKKGMSYAQQYLVDNNRPKFMPISRVMEGGENEVFNMNFNDGCGERSRDFNFDAATFKPSCCPHRPSGGKWDFTQSSSVSSMASRFGGGSTKDAADKDDPQLHEVAKEVFGFFKKSFWNR